MTANQLQWEDCTCAWCGSAASELIFEGPDRLEGLPGIFRFVRCQQCGSFRQNPRLTRDSLSEYYPENYVAYDYGADSDQNPLRKRIKNHGNWKRRRAIERFQPGGRLIEVGCGTGAFLRELLSSGHWDVVVGIEPSEKAASHVRQTLDIPIHQGVFADVTLEPESFNAVVLWCVVEHLAQPIQDLRRAHALLKKGGWLFFSIPNYESLGAKIFGKYWAGWDLPRHLYVFPRSNLLEILESIGFSNISTRCISTSYHALGHSLDFWSQDWAEKHPTLRRFLMKAYCSKIARIGLLLPLAILERLNLTTNNTYFAQ
ncbi:MAG: class I SAM-dependent methyltransferase, partial [Chloroflexi bacterium]|nr:class I SAM-dependent methyltransferase [Chloroflexota bacterium]